jgi:hypothetical protein
MDNILIYSAAVDFGISQQARPALPVMSRIASAQSYPTRPVRWIAPMALGDMPDVLGASLMSRFEGNHAGCTLRELW